MCSFSVRFRHSSWSTSPRSSRLTRSLVLSVASCNVTSFTARACEKSSLSLNEGYNFAAHVSSTIAGWMLSRHHSLFLQSLRALPRAAGRTSGAAAPHTTPPRAARVGRCLQSSTALVVVLQNDFMSLVFTNTAPTQHPSSCSSHVRSSSMFVYCRISPGFS